METVKNYRQIVEEILIEYARIPYAHGDIQIVPVFDRESDRYLLIIMGREDDRRVHGCLVHVEIINGKLWIQRDGTEQGIATELVEAGVPKELIVLGFRSAEMRKHTEFAAA
jgi:hypothetical protein